MKKDFLLSKREGLALAMEQLLHYNVWSVTSLNKSDYEEESLLKYFEADFDSPIEEKYEKIIAAAVTKTIYEKNYIPAKSKNELAKRSVRQHLESLRAAKFKYWEEVKGMPRREALTRAKENKMVKRVTIVDRTVKWGIRKGVKVGTSAAVGYLVTALAPGIAIPAWLIGLGTYAVISLLPDKIKNPIRKGVAKAVDSVVETARNIAGELADRAVVVAQKAKQTVEKVAQGARQLWEDTKIVAKETWEDTKVVAKEAWADLKEGAIKVGNKVKNYLGF